MNIELENTFQLLLDVSSSVWKKQVFMYSRPPWTLAIVLDCSVPRTVREEAVLTFFLKATCCLEKGVCRDLVHKYKSLGAHALDTGSQFLSMLFLLFTNKTTDVECENNFARSSAARSFMKGKKHESATMACKHISGEIHHQHMLCLGKSKKSVAMQRAAETYQQEANDVTVGSKVDDAVRIVRFSATGPDKPGADSQGTTKTNGYILLTKELFNTEPLLLGETTEERRKRVIAKASPACVQVISIHGP